MDVKAIVSGFFDAHPGLANNLPLIGNFVGKRHGMPSAQIQYVYSQLSDAEQRMFEKIKLADSTLLIKFYGEHLTLTDLAKFIDQHVHLIPEAYSAAPSAADKAKRDGNYYAEIAGIQSLSRGIEPKE